MIYLHTRGAFFFEPLERASVALLLKDRAELGEHLIVVRVDPSALVTRKQARINERGLDRAHGDVLETKESFARRRLRHTRRKQVRLDTG